MESKEMVKQVLESERVRLLNRLDEIARQERELRREKLQSYIGKAYMTKEDERYRCWNLFTETHDDYIYGISVMKIGDEWYFGMDELSVPDDGVVEIPLKEFDAALNRAIEEAKGGHGRW